MQPDPPRAGREIIPRHRLRVGITAYGPLGSGLCSPAVQRDQGTAEGHPPRVPPQVDRPRFWNEQGFNGRYPGAGRAGIRRPHGEAGRRLAAAAEVRQLRHGRRPEVDPLSLGLDIGDSDMPRVVWHTLEDGAAAGGLHGLVRRKTIAALFRHRGVHDGARNSLAGRRPARQTGWRSADGDTVCLHFFQRLGRGVGSHAPAEPCHNGDRVAGFRRIQSRGWPLVGRGAGVAPECRSTCRSSPRPSRSSAVSPPSSWKPE